jgi:hypothetical protein
MAPGTPVRRRHIVAALPQLALGACAGCAGALAGAAPEPGALAELRFHRFARAHTLRAPRYRGGMPSETPVPVPEPPWPEPDTEPEPTPKPN